MNRLLSFFQFHSFKIEIDFSVFLVIIHVQAHINADRNWKHWLS
jgi:hypothetical protein